MAKPPFPEIQYLRQRAHAQCMGLSFRLDELTNEFPGGTPKDFIAVLQEIIAELKDLIRETLDKGVLSWICLLVEQDLSDYLKWLDNAHTAQTPRALVKVLEDAARRLGLDPGAKLLVSPDYECNYSIDDQVVRLRKLLISFLPQPAMERIFQLLPPSLFLVQFPRVERDHVLNYAIFGHELGHPLVQQQLDNYENSRDYKLHHRPVVKELAQLQIQKGILPAYRAEQQARDFKDTSKIYRRGLEELASDAVGAFIFGSSALFAAIDHFFGRGLDNHPTPDEYYPPIRYRHRQMFAILKREGHIDCLERISRKSKLPEVRTGVPSLLRYVETLIGHDTDKKALEQNDVCAVAYRWVERSLPTLVAKLRDSCEHFIYGSDQFESEVPELLERLSIGIPPSERGMSPKTRPVDWRSSMLAGWMTRFGEPNLRGQDLEKGVKALHQIHKLTSKGLEDAILAHEYQTKILR